MFRGTISTVSLQRTGVPTVPGVGYRIYVFDEALVIAPLDSFARTRWVGGQIPVAGLFIGWISNAFAKDRKAELEHEIEELPSDITVEQLGERIEHTHAVPTAEIARLLVKPRFLAGKHYLRVRFMSRDVDRYAYRKLTRQRQTVVSDPESAKALLREVFGDRITHKSRTWAMSGRVGTLLGRTRVKARQ
jgi:hypothetical protein